LYLYVCVLISNYIKKLKIWQLKEEEERRKEKFFLRAEKKKKTLEINEK